MDNVRAVTSSSTTLVSALPGRKPETHEFGSAEAAERRARFCSEALTWVGTPFGDCGDVRGPNGRVDCAMMMVRASVDSGLLPAFDPRPYSPRFAMHSSEQKFTNFLRDRLGAVETGVPQVGDVVVWQFGRSFSHGGVLVNTQEVVHAYYAAGLTLVSRTDEAVLRFVSVGRANLPRPVKFFTLWGH